MTARFFSYLPFQVLSSEFGLGNTAILLILRSQGTAASHSSYCNFQLPLTTSAPTGPTCTASADPYPPAQTETGSFKLTSKTHA